MIVCCTKISKTHFFALTLFHKLRDFSDGWTFINFETRLDLYKHEHNPQFRMHLVVLNYTVFELEIYKSVS
jgi:hypothetical protein